MDLYLADVQFQLEQLLLQHVRDILDAFEGVAARVVEDTEWPVNAVGPEPG